jgi:hypothetical protein
LKTVNVVPTELNQRLSEIVRNSVAADRFYIAGKMRFWRLIGIGVLGFGLGGAFGLGCYGYSFVAGELDHQRILSSALSKALSDTQLQATATGTVQLQGNEIVLAKNQTVALDSRSRVLLDPASKVFVEGEMRVQAPSISAPQIETTRSTPRVSTITNFTVFKTVPFEKGSVMTGWMFLTSTQKSPTHQYCYYTESSDTPGLNVILDLGDDQKLEKPTKIPSGFDISAAYNRCVWFRGDS